jgi:hypothetical protein
VPLLGSSSAEG